MGLSWDQTLAVPLSTLLDMIAVHQIKEEGFEYRLTKAEEEQEFFRLLEIE